MVNGTVQYDHQQQYLDNTVAPVTNRLNPSLPME